MMNMDTVTSAFLFNMAGSVLRKALVGAGAWLVAGGWIDSNQAQDGAGALLVLGAIAWSAWNNHGHALVAARLAKLEDHIKVLNTPSAAALPQQAPK